MKLKRFLSMILALCLLIGSVPLAARAENAPETSVDTGDITVEGTNGFGTLLSDEISQYQSDTAQGDYPGGYTVTDLEISGSQATVTYDSMEEAQLVVALYTEDGIQLLTSASVTVSPEETQAVVTFDGEMPQYFMASAYLLSYDYSPLCASYDTPMYTREMQELLASTVDDYDPDRVLNLDDDTTTNFAVYTEDTIVIEPISGVNTVSGMDDATRTYVITNADAQITGLQPGDVFSYPYAVDEFLIVKVGSIQVNGTTVTITGADLEMEEVFSHVKMESTAASEDVVVTDLDPNDGIDYQGSGAGVQPQASTMAWEGDTELDVSHRFGLDKTFKSDKMDAEVNIQGGLEFVLDGEFQFYISWQRQFVQLELELELGVSIHVDGEISTDFDNFAEFKIGPIKGVTIICKPAFEVGFEGEMQFEIMVTTTFGIAFESGKGITNLCTSPKVETELDMEGEFFIGVDLNPTVNIISKYVAQASLSAPVGLTVNAELTGTDYDEVILGTANMGPSIHSCQKCLDIKASIQAELEVKLTFLNWDKLTKEDSFEIAPVSWPFYWSFTNSDFGSGKCPYEEYRVTVNITDPDGKGVADAVIKIISNTTNGQTEMGPTDQNGIAVGYYSAGSYIFEVTTSEAQLKSIVTIDSPCKIVLNQDVSGALTHRVIKEYESIIDGRPIATGTCGDNLKWELYSNGLLMISGTGPMYDYESYSKVPWYGKGSISKVIIGEGVTTVGNRAFYGYTRIADMTLPNTLAAIGDYAFADCESLTHVDIPDSVTTIGEGAFDDCNTLSNVRLSNHLESLSQSIFRNCRNLTSIIIPDSVGSIGENAFWCCYGLESVSIGRNVTIIDKSAFRACHSLTSLTIPDSVTAIKHGAFWSCDALVRVNIGNGVTTIEESAFQDCDSLTDVTMGNSVAIIGAYAFDSCNQLTAVNIPDTVTAIETAAFRDCPKLTSVNIPASVITIGNSAFGGCSSLRGIHVAPNNPNYASDAAGVLFDKNKTTLIQAPGALAGNYTVPDGTITIATWAFSNCKSFTGLTIPASVTTIGDSAFINCANLTSVRIGNNVNTGNGVTAIGEHAFSCCTSLTDLIIGDSVATIDYEAFISCSSLTGVFIGKSVTTIGSSIFSGCTNLTDVHYSGTQTQWEQISIAKNNSVLTNATIHYNSTGPAAASLLNPIPSGSIQAPDLPVDELNPDAVYGGEYGTEVTDDYTLKTASFTGLVPGAEYVLLALANLDVADPLAADNLLYIDQAAAGEDGTLTFRYVPRVAMDVSYVMACGPSTKNLADASITFPKMTADGTLQVVNPTVAYDGKTLTEGVDYVITGTVDYTQPGTYTCYIRGIHNYAGLVECQYTVNEPKALRLSGKGRCETAILIAEELKAALEVEKFNTIIIANGNNFADALAGSYLAAAKDAPILLSWGSNDKHAANIQYIQNNLAEDGTVYILGGTAAVPGLYEEGLEGIHVERLSGKSRFDTNIEILKAAGIDANSEILVSTGWNYADSLSASATGKPILLLNTNTGKLEESQTAFLSELEEKNCTFTIIGGEGAVSAELAADLEAYGNVDRISGKSRYETSVKVAEAYFEDPESVVLAYGRNFPDGLCGGALAFSMNAPLILTQTGAEAAAADYVQGQGIKSGVVLGGTGALSDEVVRAVFAMEAEDEIIVKK